MKKMIKASSSDGHTTVGDLKEMLSKFDDDTPIVVMQNGGYCYEPAMLRNQFEITSMWGPNFNAAVIRIRDQVGRAN